MLSYHYYAHDVHMEGHYEMMAGVSLCLSVCSVPRPNS